MPCRSDYLEPDHLERESQRVMEFLREIRGQNFNHEKPVSPLYGDVNRIHRDTELLCDWCATHDITKQSLELQLWWKRHQAADARRIAEEAMHRREAQVRTEALAKLSPEERRALGLR